MNRLSCVIFDLDGTLTQTNDLIFASFNHVAQKYAKRTFTPAEIIAMFGPPEEVAVENIAGSEFRDVAMDDFCRFYEEHHPRMAELHDRMIEVLEFLKEHRMRIALFTGKGRRTTMITLKQLGISEYFDLLVTGNDVRNHKPSADGIRLILDRFGLHSDQVIMVGDSVSDVKAAHEAGVPIAAVLWDSYASEKVEEMDVDYRFHNVGGFVEWLKESVPADGVRSW